MGAISNTNIVSYRQIGENVDNGYIYLGLRGTLNAYTMLAPGNCEDNYASIPSSGRYQFSGGELSLYIRRSPNFPGGTNVVNKIWIKKIRVYLNSTLVRTIKCHRGDVFWSSNDNIQLANKDEGASRFEYTIPFSGYQKYFGGNPYAETDVESTSPAYLYSSGYYNIEIEVDYEVDGTTYHGDHTGRWQLGRLYVEDLVADRLWLKGSTTTKFYKNATFNHDGLQVWLWYKYKSQFGGNDACTFDVTGSSTFSSPNMATVGNQNVTITNSGKSTSYAITIVGVSSISENSASKFRYLIDVSNPTPTKLTINYTDGTSREITSSISSNFAWTSGDLSAVGTRTLAYKIYDSITGEWNTGSTTKTVRDVSSLSVKTNPTKLVYQTNESHSNNGLVVTATYGDAGTFDISKTSSPVNWTQGDISISTPNMTTVGSKTVAFSYRGQSTSYGITVHGITSVRLYVPESLNKHLRGDLVTSLTDGLRVFYTRSDQAETELSLSSTKVSIDTSGVNVGVNGTYNVRVTVTHEGNSITKTYPVQVYSLESLTVSGYKSEFVHTGTAPTFSIGGLVVTAHFSDGSERELASNEYTVSAPDNMNVGSHTVTVTSTVGATQSVTYTIHVVEDYPDAIVSVDLSGWNAVHSQGDTFSKQGIIVKAHMHSGVAEKEVNFDTSLDGQIFGTDITSATTNFTIYVDTNDPENPLEVEYNSNKILNSGTLTAKYDKLNSISVNAGSSTGLLRWTRAGEEFTDWINDNNHITVTASYEYGGNKTIARGLYTLSKQPGEVWTKDDMGDNTITVSYKGKTATYTVRVSILNGISITSSRSPNKFNRNEDLDLTELTVRRFYTHDGENDEPGSMVLDDISKVTITGHLGMTPDNNDGKTHNVNFTYTEAGVTKTNYLQVAVKALSSVTLSVNKIAVNYGENFSLVGQTLAVTFNDEDAYSLTINSGNTVTINSVVYPLAISLDSPIIRNKIEGVTVGMSFGGETKYATLTIHCIYLDSIDLDASYYTGQTLFAGEAIDLSKFSVTKTIASTDTEDSNYPVETDITEDVQFSISDGQILMVGNNTIAVSYTQGVGNTQQSKSDSVTLTANQIALQSINTTGTDADDLTAMLSYVEGQNLSLADLVVNAVFNKTASNRELDLTECKVYINTTEVYYTQAVSLDDNGKSLIVAYTYDGITKTVTVGTLTVIAKVLSSIAIRASSTHKVNYLVGDKFSTAGLFIEATYNDGYEEVISSGFTTDFDAYKSNAFAGTDVGDEQEVTVSLTVAGVTCTTTYEINVGNPALSSLRFDTSLINLNVTNGSTFSLTGLKVYGIFENGYEEQLTYTAPDIATELSYNGNNEVDFPSTNLGVKNVTISCSNPYDNTQLAVTKALEVTVTPNLELVDIKLEFDMEQDPYNYRVGDTFNGKGLIVKALFKDTDWMAVTGYETSNPTLGSLLRSGGRLTVKVIYTSQGVVKSQEYTIVVAMPYDSGIVEENTYKVAFNVASVTHEEATIEFSDTTQLPLFHANQVAVDNNQEHDTYGLNIYTGADADNDCIGYLKLGATSEVDGSVIENGKLVLFDDPVNPIDGDGNIIAKFPHYVSGYADRINKCHFGIIYNKRLFVSGNPDYPNIDWHSSQVNSSQVENYETDEDRDLTYFSDLDYCKYGSENSAVKGYDIYRDGTLLVFKGKSQHEATIYTRTKQLVNASSYDGTVVDEGQLAEEAYPCFEVNPNGGSGAVSNYSVINFVGETLVFTRDGLKAITSKETTLNNAKYTYDVSSHINNKLLKNSDLDYVFLAQYKEKLLLRTDEGIYIGEFKLRDENSEYEWYFCNNINAYLFFEIDDELYFSDKQGNIARFMKDDSIIRKDKPRTYVGLGGTTLSIDSNTDEIVVSQTYADKVVEGNEFHLLSKISAITGNVTDESQVYAKMGNFVNKNYRENQLRDAMSSFDQTAWEGVIDADNQVIILRSYTETGEINYDKTGDDLLLFPTYKWVYLDNIVGDVVSVAADRPYQIKRIQSNDPLEYKFILIDELNNQIDLTGIISMRMSFRVNEVAVAYITDVTNATGGGKKFKVGLPLKNEGYVKLDLIKYMSREGTYQGVITEHVNVHSYFITKPFDLGNPEFEKTIYKWTIINDSSIASAMNVGYIASRKYADFNVAVKEIGGARQLVFDGLNFEKIHFTNDKLPHIYDKFKTLPRVGFIRFIFSNDEGTRMVLSKLDIIYSISLLMKGVR